MAIIIGIDPGTRVTGYGVICAEGDRLSGIECGVIALNEKESLAQRLAELSKNLTEIFVRFKPQEVVVERIFMGKNADSAFKLGHARGVCLQAAGLFGAPVFEYATRSVKKAVTGNGAAEKEHVKLVVENLLGLRSDFLDASDALALAVTHVREMQASALIRKALKEAQP
jgi:crossover junction endodeoxyribonuclease RuvC